MLGFSQHDLPIDLPAVEKFRQRGGLEREYFLPELLRIGWSKSSSAKDRAIVRASLNYRLAEVVMILLLPMLAVALAVPPKRSNSALGVFVSIVMVVAYHKVNEYGQSVAELGRVDPALALWGPFTVFACIIAWMYWRIAYVPGGQPIGALETFAANLGKWAKALVAPLRPAPRGWRELSRCNLEFFPSRTIWRCISPGCSSPASFRGADHAGAWCCNCSTCWAKAARSWRTPGNGEAQLWSYVTAADAAARRAVPALFGLAGDAADLLAAQPEQRSDRDARRRAVGASDPGADAADRRAGLGDQFRLQRAHRHARQRPA